MINMVLLCRMNKRIYIYIIIDNWYIYIERKESYLNYILNYNAIYVYIFYLCIALKDLEITFLK